MQYQSFDPNDPDQVQGIATVWSEACGADLLVSPRFVRYNTRAVLGAQQAGRLAIRDGDVVGCVLVSTLKGAPQVASPETGWVDALAVLPRRQGEGIGAELLGWAESWLAGEGCTRFLLGGGVRPFVPGVPTTTGSETFFAHHGYGGQPGHDRAWDVARSLRDYSTPPTANRGLDVRVAPAEPDQEEEARRFLQREFPGGWYYEFEEHLAEGGPISDFVLLWSERGVDGCLRLTYEDSLRPINRFYPYRLPRPWGQLGSVGVSADRRGRGYGAALLDGGLRTLRSQGVDGCVIDWTGIVDFYGKFGFKKFREYFMWGKHKEG